MTEETFVVNSAVLSCCGRPRGRCSCGHVAPTADPLAGYDPDFLANSAPSLTEDERRDVMPTLNLLDFDSQGRRIDDVFLQDEREAEMRRENARRVGLAIEQYDATDRDTRLDHIFGGEPEARSSGATERKAGTHGLLTGR